MKAELDTAGVIVPIIAGETILRRGKREIGLLVTREEVTITHARYAAGEQVAGRHVHHEHTDAFYVLEGELTFELGREGEAITVSSGGFVAAPPQVAHSLRNDSDRPARWLTIHARDGGFAEFIRNTRDGGVEVEWDISPAPAEGGRSASEAVVSSGLAGERPETEDRLCWLRCELPDICVAEWHLGGAHPELPLHHQDGQVSYFVIEGEMETMLGGRRRIVGPGTLISVPSGEQHALYHRGSERARMLSLHTPDGGFADCLRRGDG
jgi:quercetin dioxygenase-like cupin family protein